MAATADTSRRPLVSVVLPTRNRASTLEDAIRSVLNQSYAQLEVIVVDDASEDATADVVAGLGSDRVRLVHHARQLGAAAARNSGVEASRGELLAFQDSDDRWLPGKLDLQVGLLVEADPRVAVVYGGFLRLRDGASVPFPPRIVRWAHRLCLPGHSLSGDLRRLLPRGNVVTAQAAVVRRRSFEDAGGFDPELIRFEDWDLWLRIARHGSFLFVDRPLVEVRISSDSLSTDMAAAVADLEHMASKHQSCARFLSAASSYILGEQCMQGGEVREARRHLARAVSLAPENGWYWLALAASLAGRWFANAALRSSGLGYRRE